MLSCPSPRRRRWPGCSSACRPSASRSIVLAERDRNVELSTRNLPGAGTTQAEDMNVYQVLAHDKLVMTRDAVAKLEEALG